MKKSDYSHLLNDMNAWSMTPEEYKAIREKLALTQGGLANRLGVTRKTINARETSAVAISPEAAMAILTLKAPPPKKP